MDLQWQYTRGLQLSAKKVLLFIGTHEREWIRVSTDTSFVQDF